jgi:hypothetical protein
MTLAPTVSQSIRSCVKGVQCHLLHSSEGSALKRHNLIRTRCRLVSDKYPTKNPGTMYHELIVDTDLYGYLSVIF